MGKSEENDSNKKSVAGFFVEAGKSAAKAAKSAKDTVVKSIDYNDDGKFGFDDITTLANQIGEKKEQERLEKERKVLNPFFKDSISTPEFMLPKLVRVAEMDKKHAESKICEHSIGFKAEHEGIQIITIYPENLNLFGLNFYPNVESEIYYVDPCDRDCYIAMDQYFGYLRIKKVNELQQIAQALGARHFRVYFVEQEQTDTESKTKISAAVKSTTKAKLSGEMEESASSKDFNKIEIAAEMEFLGHEPEEPTLCYLKGEPSIESLIRLRMSRNAPIHQKVSVNLISSSGIKMTDAAKIDGALAAMNYSGKVSIQKETKKAARTVLEYEIDY